MDPRPSQPKNPDPPRVPFGGGRVPPHPFLSPPQQPDEVGRLGPYRILAELGRGGMGAVFRAEDPTLRRQVAVKVIAPHLAADRSARERFVREAQAQARVEHDHVTPIFHAGEANGAAYIVMPLLKGSTLADALDERPRLPVAEVLRIGREVAEGLAAAHAAGLIHRDIKPANVWLEGDRRRVKILDFGLARGAGESDRLTSQGMVIGTAAYMSPEQARGRPADHRSDLWSLGVLLYQVATGEKPFAGANQLSVLYAITHVEPPPPQSLAPELPPALCDLILRLLAKDPAARPESAAAVADELAGIERAFATGSVPVVLSEASGTGTNPLARLETSEVQERAEGDDVEEPEVVEAKVTPKRRRKKAARAKPRPKGPSRVLIAALALVAVAAAIGVAVLISQALKPKPAPEVAEPKRPPAVPPKPEQKPPVNPNAPAPVTTPKDNAPAGPAINADREAARLLGPQTRLGLVTSKAGRVVSIKAGDPPPNEPFTLFEVFFADPLPPDYFAKVFRPAVSRLRSLTYIRMRSGQIKLAAEQLRELAGMPFADVLRDLEAEVTLTPETLAELKKFPKLATIRLHIADADDAMLARLSELRSLRYLLLSRVDQAKGITRRGWEALARLGLEHIWINSADTSPADWFRALTAPGGPVSLDLYKCDLTDADLAALAQNPTGLARLYLREMPKITDAGLKHLEKVKSLTHLSINDCKTTATGEKAFAAARPKVEFQKPAVRLPRPPPDADREAARLLGPRAALYLRIGTREEFVNRGDPLPAESFTIAQVDFLWENLPAGYTDEVFLPAVSRLHSLARIRMARGQLRMEAEHVRALAGMPFSDTLVDLEAGVTLTPAALVELEKFQKLWRVRCRLTEADDALLARIAELPSLKVLTLSDPGDKITVKGWEAVARLKLELVSLEDAEAATATCFRVLTAPGGPRGVRLARCPLTDADLASLAQNRTDVANLYILNAPGVTDAGLKHLERVRSLKGLVVGGTSITPDELKAFWARTGVKDLTSTLATSPKKK